MQNPGDLRQAYLSGYRLDTSLPSCPGCTRSGSLSLLRKGRRATVPGLQDTPDTWCCIPCGWQGYGVDAPGLGIQVKVVDPETGHVSDPLGEIQQCWLEQEHMDVRRGGGGGAKGRRNPKPGEKPERSRIEQEAAPALKDTAVITERVETKTEIVEIWLTGEQREALDWSAELEHSTVSEVIEGRLAKLFLEGSRTVGKRDKGKKSERVRLRVTAGQKRLLVDTAQEAGVTVSRLVEHALEDIFCPSA